MDEAKKFIEEQMSKFTSKAPQMTEKEKVLYREALEKIYVQGKSLQEALGFDDKIMLFLYQQAYQLYKSGNYEKAEGYFYTLMKLNPRDVRYIIGFADCKVKRKKFNEASWAYTSFALTDLLNPIPYYYQADIMQQLGEHEGAYKLFSTVVNLCGDDPKYSLFKERADLQVKALEPLVHKEGAKK